MEKEYKWRVCEIGQCEWLCVLTSKLQASVALSTAEAEVNACTVVLQELEYVCCVLAELLWRDL